MNELKVNIKGEEVIIKNLSTASISERMEDIVLEYVGRRKARVIVANVPDIVGDENVLIVEVNKTLYKLVINNGVPLLVEYNIKNDFKIALMERGLWPIDAKECAEALFSTQKGKDSSISEPYWIPKGFKYFTGDIETGYVVKDEKGNEFTYCPSTDEYISRYEISKGPDGAPMSVPGKDAWVNITRDEAKALARCFTLDTTADLIEVSSWDMLCEFLSLKIDGNLIRGDSTSIGAYDNSVGEVQTGEKSSFMIYNIDCLAGNHWCITNDIDNQGYAIICGGSYKCLGHSAPMNCKSCMHVNSTDIDVGFRIVHKK